MQRNHEFKLQLNALYDVGVKDVKLPGINHNIESQHWTMDNSLDLYICTIPSYKCIMVNRTNVCGKVVVHESQNTQFIICNLLNAQFYCEYVICTLFSSNTQFRAHWG